MVSQEVKALTNLASQLGVPANKEETGPANDINLLWKDGDDCDFSSFPSLSLEESPGNYHTGNFTSRGDVESHVESLLSRPILLGKEDDERSTGNLLDPESDSLDEFFVEHLEEVPKFMLTNFCTSFATLMNSRLRAYASFLARHVASHARCSKTDQELEGVIGIEQKLEAMLAIGSQFSTGSVSSEFLIDQDKVPEMLPTEGDVEDVQVSLPVKMDINVDIELPHVKEADGNEVMKVSFQTTGKICGIFAKPTKEGQETSLLRVAEVSLNMHELLTAMAGQASKVISCIVQMINAAYAVPLPSTPVGPGKVEGESPRSLASMIRPEKRKAADAVDDDAIVSLSAEKCATIVDCVFGGELDDVLLTPHTVKKVKFSHLPHTILTD